MSKYKFDVKKINEKFIKDKEEERKDFNKANQKYINQLLLEKCESGDLKTFKEIIFSEKFKDHYDIHYISESFLSGACKSGNLEMVKYLLTSDELKENSDYKKSKNLPFINALLWKSTEVLEYLIFDLKIEKNQEIIDILDKSPSPMAESFFRKRDLDNSLDTNVVNGKKFKL